MFSERRVDKQTFPGPRGRVGSPPKASDAPLHGKGIENPPPIRQKSRGWVCTRGWLGFESRTVNDLFSVNVSTALGCNGSSILEGSPPCADWVRVPASAPSRELTKPHGNQEMCDLIKSPAAVLRIHEPREQDAAIGFCSWLGRMTKTSYQCAISPDLNCQNGLSLPTPFEIRWRSAFSLVRPAPGQTRSFLGESPSFVPSFRPRARLSNAAMLPDCLLFGNISIQCNL